MQTFASPIGAWSSRASGKRGRAGSGACAQRVAPGLRRDLRDAARQLAGSHARGIAVDEPLLDSLGDPQEAKQVERKIPVEVLNRIPRGFRAVSRDHALERRDAETLEIEAQQARAPIDRRDPT